MFIANIRLTSLQGKSVSFEKLNCRFISDSAVCWPVPNECTFPNTCDSCQNNLLERGTNSLIEPLKLFLDRIRNVEVEYLFLLKALVRYIAFEIAAYCSQLKRTL